MNKWAYYNENDAKAASWIRELMKRGLIMEGEVDERSITEVDPEDVKGFLRCHWFAGIAGWELALQLAGWPADRPVWTGSCPCQPFSNAGKGFAQKDERHLWPVFFNLIRQCRPPIVFGEQVASAAVVGHSDKNKSMQSVRGRETLFRILQELKRGAAGNMQGLCKDGGASAEAEQAQDGKGRLQKMEGRETRLCSCKRGEAQSQELWDTLRPLGREHSGKDRQGGLRSDRDTLRPIDSPLLERTLTGPNHTQSGIHHGEYPSGLICPECHGELLGVTEDCGSVEGYSWVEERSLEQIIGFNREEAPRTLEECWLDGVSADLEAEGYACGAAVLGAHSVNAPHQRQRLYWVAHAGYGQRGWPSKQQSGCQMPTERSQATTNSQRCGTSDGLAHAHNAGSQRRISGELQEYADQCATRKSSASDGLAHDEGSELQRERAVKSGMQGGPANGGGLVFSDCDGCEQGRHAATSAGHRDTTEPASVWSDFRLVRRRDGKTCRIPTEPAFFPLAHGVPARVVRLRGYGNAIVPQVAAVFIQEFLRL